MADDRVAALLVLAAESDRWELHDAIEQLDAGSQARWTMTNVGMPDGVVNVILVVDRDVEPQALIERSLGAIRAALPDVEITATHQGSRLPDMPFDLLDTADMWSRHHHRRAEPLAADMEPRTHRYLILLMNYLDHAEIDDMAAHRPATRAYVEGCLDVMARFGLISPGQRVEWAARADGI